MTSSTSTTSDVVYVAIDIAKMKHDILVKKPDGKCKAMKIGNCHSDFEKLSEYLRSFNLPCRIAFEPTADYHRLIAWRLLSDGHELFLASSIACARTREAIFNSRDKNDIKDARVILYLLEAGVVQHYHDPLANNLNDLQELSNTYATIAFRRTQLLHSIKNHYIALYFPEIEKFMNSTRSVWFTRTFTRFPTPGSIAKHTEQEFYEIAYPIVGKKKNKKQWVLELYRTACTSIGLPVEENSVATKMFSLMLKEYERQTDIRQQIQDRADEILSSNKDYQVLCSLPGIGPVIALTILAEAGDMRRFSHHRQFLKFCGFDLATQQSGKYKSSSTLSKRGNARLRMAFWQAGRIAVQRWTPIIGQLKDDMSAFLHYSGVKEDEKETQIA